MIKRYRVYLLLLLFSSLCCGLLIAGYAWPEPYLPSWQSLDINVDKERLTNCRCCFGDFLFSFFSFASILFSSLLFFG